MKVTQYYLNERLVDRKDIPSTAIFDRRVKREEKSWRVYKITELHYITKKGGK